jgi:hypothetical protein
VRSGVRAALLAIALVWCVGAVSSLTMPSIAVAALDEQEISDALEQVRADPNISSKRTLRTLKWVDGDKKPTSEESPGWLSWLVGLFAWLANMSRLLLWIGIVFVLGLLGLFLKRVLSGYERTSYAKPLDAPTHVREMDIRPESLPDDIGGAALQLWEGNDHRAALALLYRGLLSRLVHSHGVPIRESTTEADCLQLAVPRLHADTAEYTALLVRVWQHAVYGAKEPVADDVRKLCSRFSESFPLSAQPTGGRP